VFFTHFFVLQLFISVVFVSLNWFYTTKTVEGLTDREEFRKKCTAEITARLNHRGWNIQALWEVGQVRVWQGRDARWLGLRAC